MTKFISIASNPCFCHYIGYKSFVGLILMFLLLWVSSQKLIHSHDSYLLCSFLQIGDTELVIYSFISFHFQVSSIGVGNSVVAVDESVSPNKLYLVYVRRLVDDIYIIYFSSVFCRLSKSWRLYLKPSLVLRRSSNQVALLTQ